MMTNQTNREPSFFKLGSQGPAWILTNAAQQCSSPWLGSLLPWRLSFGALWLLGSMAARVRGVMAQQLLGSLVLWQLSSSDQRLLGVMAASLLGGLEVQSLLACIAVHLPLACSADSLCSSITAASLSLANPIPAANWASGSH